MINGWCIRRENAGFNFDLRKKQRKNLGYSQI